MTQDGTGGEAQETAPPSPEGATEAPDLTEAAAGVGTPEGSEPPPASSAQAETHQANGADPTEAAPDSSAGQPEQPGEPGAPGVSELAAAHAALAERTADLQRLQAEFLNYKRRVERDRELVSQNATFRVLAALLPVLDDIDRASDHGELEGGFKAVADSLMTVIGGFGLDRYGAKGEEFDPNLHEALMHGHSPEVSTTTVDVVAQAGYRVGDRVVRAAKVTVLDPES